MLFRQFRTHRERLPRRAGIIRSLARALIAAAGVSVLGCASYDTLKKTVGNNTGEIDYVTAQVDNPEPEIYPEAWATAPLTAKSLRDMETVQYREVSLTDVLGMALGNSEVLRELGGTILRTPEAVRSRYLSGLQETDPRFGMEAALSAFDAQFKANANFSENDRVFNNSFLAGGANSFMQDLHEYKMELSKRTAAGTLMIFRTTSDLDANNSPGNIFPSAWNSAVEAELRQPLLAGGGLQFNRIAGPASTPGVYNGILIARVAADITQTDFEIAVRDYVSNVVNAYWDLYFAYRELDARTRAMNNALDSWRKIKAQVDAEGLPAAREALAREQYYRFKSEVEDSLTGRLLQGTQNRNGSPGGTLRGTGGVQVCERRLRLIIGLPISDGALLRPAQDPEEAEVVFDWESCLRESLSRRPELRRQQLRVRRREMEVLAAQNFLNPQLDVIGRYRFRGFGDDLVADGNQIGSDAVSSIGNLASGHFQEWLLGVELSIPIGFRQGHAAVCHAELSLAHERAIHREQEREVVHDLSNALADAVRAYDACETNLNRYLAAREVFKSLEAEEKNGLPVDIDRVLDSQRRIVEAEIRYYQSRTEYAVAQKNVHLEKGSLMAENGLSLFEGAVSSPVEESPSATPASITPPAPIPE